MFKKFLALGEMTIKKVISYLFYTGIFVIGFKAYLIGRNVYLTHTYQKDIADIHNGVKLYTFQEVNNAPLGFLIGIFSFIALVIIWKMVCELLLVMFKFFESNVKHNA